MSFCIQGCLAKATGRAKSDVANKLISMLLHETSRRICSYYGLSVGDPRYGESVFADFGNTCCYCDQILENDRTVVEHPEGMNRFRAGLHIPGNALIACKKCNNEKGVMIRWQPSLLHRLVGSHSFPMTRENAHLIANRAFIGRTSIRTFLFARNTLSKPRNGSGISNSGMETFLTPRRNSNPSCSPD
jgi:hypothetical protein